jgi:hypothetical protein
MPPINYSHQDNIHTLSGPRVALPLILKQMDADSLLDVGCGIGVWVKAALDLGLQDVQGIDGVPIDPANLVIPESHFQVRDFTSPLSLGRQFDVALCLEVAEHIPEEHTKTLIGSLTAHSNIIVFSAACPGQEGQNHVNCQWPSYWQKIFNQFDYVCADELRESIWNDERIEPWYRQNIFIARRVTDGSAGKEPRLHSMVHPELIQGIVNTGISKYAGDILNGRLPAKWYLKLPLVILKRKIMQKHADGHGKSSSA